MLILAWLNTSLNFFFILLHSGVLLQQCYCNLFAIFDGTFFSRVFFFNHSLTPVSSPDNRDMPIVRSSPTWAKSTCFFPVDHDPWPFYLRCGWIWGCPGLTQPHLNQGAQNKADYVSYTLEIGRSAGVTAYSPTWARVSLLSPELWKGDCFMSLIYLGSLRMCPKIAIGFLAQSILSD